MRAPSSIEEWLAWLDARQEEERIRIAHGLHDLIGANLTLARFTLARLQQVCSDAGAVELAAELGQRLDNAIQHTNEISCALRPGMLNAAGLSSALESLFTSFCESAGIACREMDLPDLVAPEAVATPVYRIAESTLAMFSQARPRALTVSMGLRGRVLALEVKARGVAGGVFDSGASRIEWGWIALRAKLLHGRAAIEAVPPDATVIKIAIPLEDQQSHDSRPDCG